MRASSSPLLLTKEKEPALLVSTNARPWKQAARPGQDWRTKNSRYYSSTGVRVVPRQYSLDTACLIFLASVLCRLPGPIDSSVARILTSSNRQLVEVASTYCPVQRFRVVDHCLVLLGQGELNKIRWLNSAVRWTVRASRCTSTVANTSKVVHSRFPVAMHCGILRLILFLQQHVAAVVDC